jgi:hypothetical protein
MPSADDEFDTEATAALDFEAFPQDWGLAQFAATPWTLESAEIGVTLRVAAITLEQTKAQLIEVARKLGQDQFLELLDSLRAQEKRLTQLAEMLRAVQARLVVAGSALGAPPIPSG